ncbi:MAG TPA: hypothetical protein DCL49_02075 [Candidatus Omnitrophica bacterium]|nr:hypothetical protein [Candidatus Omnitrophota bacterium]HBG64074.1 hypothetical protein [Candidatus Omnitrophota bacterium]
MPQAPKLGQIKEGEEIACRIGRQAVEGDLSSAIGVFAGVNSVNNDIKAFNVETNAIFSNSKSMGSWWKIYQGFGKMQGIARGNIESYFFNNSVLQLAGETLEVSFADRGKFKTFNHLAGQDNPNSCLIFSKGTSPNFRASSMPFFSFSANLGLTGRWVSMASISQPTGLRYTYSLAGAFSSNFASKAQSISQSEYVSNIKYLGEPPLSVITPALKSLGEANPAFLSSLAETVENFVSFSNFTRFFPIDTLDNDFAFIFLLLKKKNNISGNLSQGKVIFEPIVKIEPLGRL